jgi:polysaccharide biosynthesis protein PslH
LKILHVALYQKLFPPKNGGMLRSWNITKQLSLYFEVDLFCLQPDIKKELADNSHELKGHRLNLIAPAEKFDLVNHKGLRKIKTAFRYRWENKTLAPANSKGIEIATMWDEIKDEQFDIVLFEHIESLWLRSKCKKLFPGAKIILDAHNVDHLLMKNEVSKKTLERIKKREAELHKTCDLVFACSEKDANFFRELNENKLSVYVLPNGVDSKINSYCFPDFSERNRRIIFCGSLDYPPNREGLSWFLKEIWPVALEKISPLELTIVGKGHPGVDLMDLIKSCVNVRFIGEVEDVIPYYRQSQLAIVPLLHGSGTRLKILEAMSLGVPVLSTTIGAEGIKYIADKDILIANNSEAFVEQLIYFCQNGVDENISKNARKLVDEHYSWKTIGIDLNKWLEEYVKGIL